MYVYIYIHIYTYKRTYEYIYTLIYIFTEDTLKLDKKVGTENEWITVTSFDSSSRLRGSGRFILNLHLCQYVRVVNLTIIGEAQQITFAQVYMYVCYVSMHASMSEYMQACVFLCLCAYCMHVCIMANGVVHAYTNIFMKITPIYIYT